SLPIKDIRETDMLENEKSQLNLTQNGTAQLYFRPFEIKTIRIVVC
ncbi:MAG: hypothetical protein JWN30_1472, partial [Bacilli bacterium]|nr:hypothetical protein [Bacilli bacterium]